LTKWLDQEAFITFFLSFRRLPKSDFKVLLTICTSIENQLSNRISVTTLCRMSDVLASSRSLENGDLSAEIEILVCCLLTITKNASLETGSLSGHSCLLKNTRFPLTKTVRCI